MVRFVSIAAHKRDTRINCIEMSIHSFGLAFNHFFSINVRGSEKKREREIVEICFIAPTVALVVQRFMMEICVPLIYLKYRKKPARERKRLLNGNRAFCFAVTFLFGVYGFKCPVNKLFYSPTKSQNIVIRSDYIVILWLVVACFSLYVESLTN